MKKGLLLFIIFLMLGAVTYAQQNPFDVYRKADPNPVQIDLSFYKLPNGTKAKLPSSDQGQFQSPLPKNSDLSASDVVNSDISETDLASNSTNEMAKNADEEILVEESDNPFDVFASTTISEEDKFIPETTGFNEEESDIPVESNLPDPILEDSSALLSAILPEPAIDSSVSPEISDLLVEEKLVDSAHIDLEKNPFDITTTKIDSSANTTFQDYQTQFSKTSIEDIAEKDVDLIESSSSASENIQEEDDSTDNKQVKGYFNNILSNYIFWVLLVFLIVLTFIVNLDRKLIPNTAQSLLSDNYLRITYREYYKGFTPVLSYILYANFFVQSGIFFYLAQKPFLDHYPNDWYVLVGVVAGGYLLKHLVLWILGALFPVRKEVSQHNFVIMQFNLILGLIFFALNWLLAFGPENLSKPLIFTGLGSLGVMYLLRQFRGLLLSSRILSSYTFHFFLYLCAVEIAPILLLFRLLRANF